MSLGQLLPRMKRELEILERDPPPSIVCYPVDDSLLHFCAQIKGPNDTPYEDGLFKVDVQIPSRYPMEPPKMQFITPIYHPNVDDAGRICLDILKMPPKGSWKPSLNISTTLTSLSVLMADPNPDDPLLVEIACEFKENKPLFLQKARQATLKHAMDDKKLLNPKDHVQESERASSTSINNASLQQDILQEFATQSPLQNEVVLHESTQVAVPKKLNKNEESNLLIITQKREKKKMLSLSKANNSKIEKKVTLEQISNQPKSVPTVSTLVKTNTWHLTNSKSLQEEKVDVPLEQISNQPKSVPAVSTSVKTNTWRLTNSKSLQEEKVEKRKPLGDITKKSINVPANNQVTTNVTVNVLSRAERKRNLLRKKPNDIPVKKQKI